ncbi:transposase [bacterium Scap17]|uniref:integrase core domain-containing protein n=1 Tax=Cobetia amphilecti TaxID=1055104 RepID=UPI00159D3F5F|nr:integrase core domain-containing protein [Cobetia amphilecti]NVN56302.1 transposase [bacterium Scap17]UBU47570.1 integrase core domain-containing protein [Cobetia amphilecti]
MVSTDIGGGLKARVPQPHRFDVVCHRHGIEYRLIRPIHPWTNGQVERINHTIKEALARSFHYATLGELSAHLKDYLWGYNSARSLRALKGKRPLVSFSNVGKTILSDSINIPSYFPGPYTALVSSIWGRPQ